MAIFPTFFFRQYRPWICLLPYSRTKKCFLAYKIKKLKKSKNCHFSQGHNPCFWSKNGHFSNFFFWQYRQGKCLLRYSRTKKMPFWAIKTRSSKSAKVDIFLKGLTHGFRPKTAIFPTFFLGNIDQENAFYDILERKNTFLGYRNKKFKKSKNWHFRLKGLTHGFGLKMAIFPTFFFGNIDKENVFYDILEQKKCLSGL